MNICWSIFVRVGLSFIPDSIVELVMTSDAGAGTFFDISYSRQDHIYVDQTKVLGKRRLICESKQVFN